MAPHGQTGWLALGRPQQLSWAEGWPGPQKPSTVPPGGAGKALGWGTNLWKEPSAPPGDPEGQLGQGGVPRWHGGPEGEGTVSEAEASEPRTASPRCVLRIELTHPHGQLCQVLDVDGPAGGSAPGTEPKVQGQDGGGFWEKGPLAWVLRSWMPSGSSRPRNPKETSRSVRLGGCMDQPQLPRR